VTLPPTPEELLAARRFVAEHHPRTPLRPFGTHGGAEVLVKCEDEAPVRSFKGRGALWSLARLDAGARARGVVTASTGNHAQGVAAAGRLLGVPTAIVVPESTSAQRVERTRALGGDVRRAGANLSESELHAREIAEREGRRYLEDGEDPGLMAGAASLAFEVLEQADGVDVIVVPVGGGNLIAGVALAAKRLNPAVRIVGVQSEAAPSVARSFAAGHVVEAPCATIAGGLATGHPGHLAFEVIRDHVDELRLVSENDLARHVVRVLDRTGALIEPAAAAPFALLERTGSAWDGARVVLLQTGGSIAVDELRTLLAAHPEEPVAAA
jgi:threonine dehydratase